MKFYVYTLADPRNGAVFYVGKGQGNRAWQHTKDARAGRVMNREKHDRIVAIIKARKEPRIEIVQQFEDEEDAVAYETHLIRTLPALTNAVPQGYLSPKPDPVAYLKRWLKLVETWPNGPTFPGMANGHIEAHNFVVQVRRLLAEKDSTEIHEGRQEAGSWKTGRVTKPAHA